MLTITLNPSLFNLHRSDQESLSHKAEAALNFGSFMNCIPLARGILVMPCYSTTQKCLALDIGCKQRGQAYFDTLDVYWVRHVQDWLWLSLDTVAKEHKDCDASPYLPWQFCNGA